MQGLPQIKEICINDYIKEIHSSLENKNYLSALSVALMIPDICRNQLGLKRKSGYINWFNKYVFKKYYDIPSKHYLKKLDKGIGETYRIKFNGNVCYALRCAILHTGSTVIEFENKKDKLKARIDKIELCINSESNFDNQYGESSSIVTFSDNTKSIRIRVNIITLIKNILAGYKTFLKENNIDKDKLFYLIDFDKKGNIIFTPIN